MASEKTYIFRPLKSLATWARVLMIIQMVATGIFMAVLITALVMGSPVSFNGEDLSDFSAVASLVALVSLAIKTVSGIVAMIWVYRAGCNTRALRPTLDFKPIWAIIWYFVPIAFLFKPYQYMCQIWVTAHGPKDGRYAADDRPVAIWWALFIVGSISGNIAWRLPDPTAYTVLALISGGFGIFATLRFMDLVRIITQLQGDTDTRVADQF